MVRIAPVNLRCNPKTLWFDAGDLEVSAGDGVVVSTARGTEFGRAAGEVFEADEEQVSGLRSALKPVLRVADEADEQQALEMERKSAEALPVFKELAAQTSDQMHPVSVEYLFEGEKAVFYFEAEERIDFRELVRTLASRFHVRIDMRQIGVRDEARMIGGLGHCGQELCCRRLGGEFCPVSIRMAKEQDLSLNPQKISGLCGRLMCCLRYEYDAYKDFKGRAPKQNAQIEVPGGVAKVVDLDVPREIVSLRVEGEKPVKVPLADFDPPEEGAARPVRVGAEAWERAQAVSQMGPMGEAAIYATTQLTGKDKLADPTAVRRTGKSGQQAGGGKAAGKGGGKGQGRKQRPRRSTKVGAPEGAQDAGRPAAAEGQQPAKPKKRSQRKRQGGASKQQGQQKRQQQGQQQGQQPARGAQRPGQKSSGLRNPQQPAAQEPREGEAAHRKSRRRTHKATGAQSQDTTGQSGD